MSIPLQVYEPFRAGLPKLGKYWKSLWSRRTFISEYSKSELREQHFDSVFGQLWLVLNPLLLSGVYIVLMNLNTKEEIKTLKNPYESKDFFIYIKFTNTIFI